MEIERLRQEQRWLKNQIADINKQLLTDDPDARARR